MNNIEITTDQLSKYIKSSKACKFINGCTMESKFSRIVFDFNMNVEKIILHSKKISGNGKIKSTIIDNKTEDHIIFSKISQNLDIVSLNGHSKLELVRSLESTGEINIFGITLQLANLEESPDLSTQWKNIISKCGKYQGLRMVGPKLFASEGSSIEQENIISNIETNPANMFLRTDNKIKFLDSCEIITIELNQNITNNIISNQLFVHRDAPTPINPSAKNAPTIVPIAIENLIITIFDSNLHRSFEKNKSVYLNNNKQAKLVNSNAKDYLVIKRGGLFTIPIAELQANFEYTISITVQKLNGNGRIHVGVISDKNINISNTETCIADSSIKIVDIKINTESGNNFKLQLSMQEDGIGEVLISRILIGKKIKNYQYITDNKSSINYPISPRIIFTEQQKLSSQVKINTQHAALLDIQNINFPFSYPEINGTIEATNFKSKLWLSRILNIFPNVKPIKLNVENLNSNLQPNIVLTSLDTLKPNKKIWLEEYSNEITKSHYDILNQIDIILTPSLTNSIELKSLFNNKQINIYSLNYPYSFVDKNKENNVIYFESNSIYTKNLISIWKQNYPKLIIVGTTIATPDYIKVISEYENYNSLFKLIAKTKYLIDLNDNNHYKNPWIDLCQKLSTNVITNNHQYLFKPNIKIIKNINNIINSMEELNFIENNEESKDNLNETMLMLLGDKC